MAHVLEGTVGAAAHDGLRWVAMAAVHARAARRQEPWGAGQTQYKVFAGLFSQFLFNLPKRLSIDLPTLNVWLAPLVRKLSRALIARHAELSGQQLTPVRLAEMAEVIYRSNRTAGRADSVPFRPLYVSPIWLMQAAHSVLSEASARRRWPTEDDLLALACVGAAVRALKEMQACGSCFRWAVPGLPYCHLHGLARVDGSGKGQEKERQRHYEAARRVADCGAWPPTGLPRDFARITTNRLPQLVARILWRTELPDELRTVRALEEKLTRLADVAPMSKPSESKDVFDQLRETWDPFEYRPSMWQDKLIAMEKWHKLAIQRAPGRRGPSRQKVEVQIRRAEGLAERGFSKSLIADSLQVSRATVSRWLNIREGRQLAYLLDPSQRPDLARKRNKLLDTLAKARSVGHRSARKARSSTDGHGPDPRAPALAWQPVVRLSAASPLLQHQAPANKWQGSGSLLMEFEEQLEKRCRLIERRVLKQYIAYRVNGNFATVVQRQKHLLVYLHLRPDAACIPPDLGRSVLGLAHLGTGDVELTVRTPADLEAAMPFVEAAYQAAHRRAES